MSVSECAHSKLFSASSQMGSLLSRLQHAVIVLDYRVASTDVKVIRVDVMTGEADSNLWCNPSLNVTGSIA